LAPGNLCASIPLMDTCAVLFFVVLVLFVVSGFYSYWLMAHLPHIEVKDEKKAKEEEISRYKTAKWVLYGAACVIAFFFLFALITSFVALG